MAKKFLGIFSRERWVWLHYIPLTIFSVATIQLISHLFKIHAVHKWYVIAAMLISVYIVVSITDQIVHAIIRKD